MRRDLGATVTAHGISGALDNEIIDPVLERTLRRHAIELGEVALVFAEQPFAIGLTPRGGLAVGQLRVPGEDLIAIEGQAGFLAVGDQLQVLRAHRCGNTRRRAGCSARLCTVTRMKTSSAVCLAYSTVTSK